MRSEHLRRQRRWAGAALGTLISLAVIYFLSPGIPVWWGPHASTWAKAEGREKVGDATHAPRTHKTPARSRDAVANAPAVRLRQAVMERGGKNTTDQTEKGAMSGRAPPKHSEQKGREKRRVDEGKDQLEQILARIRGSPVVHRDETGWREDGHNGYTWTFSTPSERYFTHGSREKEMVDAVLGELTPRSIDATPCWPTSRRAQAKEPSRLPGMRKKNNRGQGVQGEHPAGGLGRPPKLLLSLPG